MEDREIVSGMRARKENAIRAAEEKYGAYCRKIAGNVLSNAEDVKECLNDVWLAAWNSIPPNEPENLKTYLGKLTRELSVDRFRTNHRKKRVPEEKIEAIDELEEMIGSSDVEASVLEAELAGIVSAFLRSLPEKECDVFLRRYWFFDGIRDISKRYGYSESKVKMTLFRIREKLKTRLKKEGYLS